MTPTRRRPSSTGNSHIRCSAIRSQTWSTGSFTPIVIGGFSARDDAVAFVGWPGRRTWCRSCKAMTPCRSPCSSQTGRNATSRLRITPATSSRGSLHATLCGSRVITSRARRTTGQSAHGRAASGAERAVVGGRAGANVTESLIVDLPLNEDPAWETNPSRWRVWDPSLGGAR